VKLTRKPGGPDRTTLYAPHPHSRRGSQGDPPRRGRSQEIEDILIEHPKVVDVAVIGVPDDEFGEQVKAVMQPLDPSDPRPEMQRELLDWCRSRLPLQVPQDRRLQNGPTPSPTGTLLKRSLRAEYRDPTDRKS
jgi:acyl-CoA synthetase (AMP-forming)/AMP-acid ligase II